jgi:serine/threonine protein kinase
VCNIYYIVGKQGVVDNETANSFVREALRMRHFDHPHVMKLIGICWAMEANFLSVDLFQLASGPLILLPYTELGDLRGYLRDKRRYSLSSGNPYVIISNISTDTNDKEDECLIPVGQLVKFGYQIAIGMEYVSKQGIVHRDLATRNCMLTWDMNIKVSDFGLARMLEEGKDYYRMGQGSALPIRWMAPESIADLLFTTESDVVSYIWHFSHNAHVLIYLFGYLCRLVSIWYSLTGVWAWRHLISLPPNLN